MSSKPEWVAVGRIRRPHGLLGEVSVEVFGEDAGRFRPGRAVFLTRPDGRRRRLVVSALRESARKAIVAFEGMSRIEDVEGWRDAVLEVPAEELPPLDGNRYYFFQLLNLEVRDAEGRRVGSVQDVIAGPAQPLLDVQGEGRRHLIPFAGAIVAEVDLDRGILTLGEMEGLLDL
jgi:16S rRNA processing protein RimM